VDISSYEKTGKLRKRNKARSVNGQTTRAKLAFHTIGLGSRGIHPKFKAKLRLLEVLRIRFDERRFIVGNPPIA
jgi:hypothetical protein